MHKALIEEKKKNFSMHYTHPPFNLEKKLLRAIELGKVEESLTVLTEINALERANLAKNKVRSIKNSLIASCTLFTRSAIEAGVIPEDAFDLSDVFIKHIEKFHDVDELLAFEAEMVREFIALIKESTLFNYQYPISKIVRYIMENIFSRLTVANLAELVFLSPDYLSRLFHKEVGIPITLFIQQQKVEVAKHFLEFDDMSITELSEMLDFCNQGYFTNTFKKITGVTPAAYRKSKKSMEKK